MDAYDLWLAYFGLYFWPAFALGSAVTVAWLARRYITAMEQRAESKVEHAQLLARVVELETALDDAQTAVTRLEAAQDFTTRLLPERVADRT